MVAALPYIIAEEDRLFPTNDVNLQRFINLLHEIGEIPEAIQAERLVAPTK